MINDKEIDNILKILNNEKIRLLRKSDIYLKKSEKFDEREKNKRIT